MQENKNEQNTGTIWFAHFLNWTARSLFTLNPTAIIACKL